MCGWLGLHSPLTGAARERVVVRARRAPLDVYESRVRKLAEVLFGLGARTLWSVALLTRTPDATPMYARRISGADEPSAICVRLATVIALHTCVRMSRTRRTTCTP
uniref:Uncharacterized protein n=1 Tax=Diacronema lutheri TaxID=2081491 RepID=A0A7R9UVJ4_DIALT